MKSSTLKAALVIVSLLATSAVHAQIDDMDREILEGKIQAAMAQQKKYFNPLDQVADMKKELVSIEKQIFKLQDDVGYSVDNSNGVISGLAANHMEVKRKQAEFLKLDSEIQSEHGYGLALKLDEANALVKEARQVLKESKEMVKKAYEPSEE